MAITSKLYQPRPGRKAWTGDRWTYAGRTVSMMLVRLWCCYQETTYLIRLNKKKGPLD